MSDPLAEFLSIPTPSTVIPEGAEEIEGTLDCGYCYKTVRKGLYFPKKGRVEFTCQQGHLNKVDMEL